MSSEERLLVALRRGQPDRVPVLIWLNPFAQRWATGISASVDPDEAGYREVLEVARECGDAIHDWGFPSGFFYSAWDVRGVSERLGPERIKHTVQTPKGPLWTVVQDRSGGGVEKHWVETVEDAERLLSIPYVPSRPDLATFKATRAASQGRYISMVTMSDPVNELHYINPTLRCLWTLTERGLLREILDVAYERISDALDYLLTNGMGPLFYFNGPEYALPPLMSPADFDEFVIQYDTKLVAKIHAHGQLTQIHSHGRVDRFLEAFASTGTDSLNVLEPPPLGDVILRDAKRRVGGRMCLIGNIQYEDLAAASEDEVEEMVRRTIEDGAPGGGFILSPCAAPYEVPLPPRTARNLIRYVEAGRRYGAYGA